MRHIRKRLTYANVMSSIAVFLVMGGAAIAATQLPKNSVGTKQLKKNAVIGSKVKDGSLTGADINLSSLGTVPSATNASHATNADNATNANNADKLGGVAASSFLRGTITVVARGTVTAGPGTFDEAHAECPTGYQAIGGGVDPSNVLTMSVTASEPYIEGFPRMTANTTGNHAAATGWIGWVRNENSTAGSVTVAAICAPLG